MEKEWFLDLIPAAVTGPVNAARNPDKPDVGITWRKWHFAGERWCVPIFEFLVALDVPSEEVIAKLHTRNGSLHYGDEWLQTGFYVPEGGTPKPDQRSWAAAQELLEVIGK